MKEGDQSVVSLFEGRPKTGIEMLADKSRQTFDVMLQRSQQQWAEMAGKSERFWQDASRRSEQVFPPTSPFPPDANGASNRPGTQSQPETPLGTEALPIAGEEPPSESIDEYHDWLSQEFRERMAQSLAHRVGWRLDEARRFMGLPEREDDKDSSSADQI
jgi:hypothetical protein